MLCYAMAIGYSPVPATFKRQRKHIDVAAELQPRPTDRCIADFSDHGYTIAQRFIPCERPLLMA